MDETVSHQSLDMSGTRSIDINLRRDLVAIHCNELIRLGFDVREINDGAALLRVSLGVCRRLVSPRPRRILKARDFSCNPEHREVLGRIEQIIRDGGDVTPFLSMKIKCLEYNDAMLNDWGIHHLHLGIRVESNGFVSRTGSLLFCRFEDDHAYFIAILPHGSWSKQRLVKTIHENWPALIDRYRVRGVTGDRITDDEIAVLRKAHVNWFIEIEDGVAYLPIGGGTVSSGENLLDVRQADMCLRWADQMQQKIVEALPEIEKRASDRGIVFSDPPVFEMRFWRENFLAIETSTGYGLVLGTP